MFPRKGGNLCRIATLEDAQFIRLANLLAETHTARAQNATFGVKDHIRPKVHYLAPMHFFFLETTMVEAILHVIVLQPAFPRLVANRTIERMIDEQEFQHPAAAFNHPRGVSKHHHIIYHWRITANFQLRAPLQLNETHAAIARNTEFGVVTVVRDGHASLMRRLDNRGVVSCRNFLAVNGQLFCHEVVLSVYSSPLGAYAPR